MQGGSFGKTVHTLWHSQRIKGLVRERVGQGAQCLVSVREVMCTDPACEGLATEIRVTTLQFREIRVQVHKPADQVTAADIAYVM
ncbi:hypothetical protein SAMN04488030_0140 [Aliiroseovarius halocynthiae]|uniref:Uncharacterized protein n=1 Tax=Aliiroseovarius halocynthiae TaxID=985055 RepID=A0A545SL75_9RHOB|nr:hypothetical protein [Aliiroseovarius halocynthiae]TQV65734.1 hypothetical protein FIL88_16220 [Aliiroseovarius halocynthiae]SMR83998.1 hypothetical protein SAMN04488030_0140 [Aliiroseovarius halocynthiae]